MTDVALNPDLLERVAERRAEVRAFMEEHVYPAEPALAREDEAAEGLIEELRSRAKAAGIWAPHLPPEAGGTGSGFIEYALLNEEIGRSTWAQLVFNCQAPDAGNGEILHLYGTDEQKERFLRPLVDGTQRSFFSMTEPEVSGADPTQLRTRAVQDGDEWVIDGHKWFSSSAEGAAFGIVMAVTDPDAPPHGRMSQILVPADTPGFEVVRPVPVLGHRGRGWSTHCEVRYTGVRVPLENVLGEPGDGFRSAQKRLGPGRIHHVMRWLGQMQRAFELMCAYALEREAFGGPLAEKQTIQNWIADSAAEIQACRLMTLDAARKLDEGDEARVEVSLIKFFAAKVLHDVIDRAVQTHGARGLTDETPLGQMYAMARGARIYDGPDEVHRMVVSRRILREFADGGVYRFS
ncbi:MAG TPA: acyl-CoA dehydrogenase family protein [Gaiellaceae bacterium]|nr:acyl-CoA dehydrogenase family protein [Gaiellaceae bacterium]